MVCKDPATAQLFEVGASIRQRYIDTAQKCDTLFLYNAIEIANKSDLEYRLSKNKRLLLELTFIKLCQLIDNPNPSAPRVTSNSIKPIVQSTQPAVASNAPTPSTEGQQVPQANNYQSSTASTNTIAEPTQQQKTDTQKNKKGKAILNMGVSLALKQRN